jgi:transcription-repair coupling factor (superfamily II helicase)
VKNTGAIIRSGEARQRDVLIGTHRLLSKDIGFKDLGLLVIDEDRPSVFA